MALSLVHRHLTPTHRRPDVTLASTSWPLPRRSTSAPSTQRYLVAHPTSLPRVGHRVDEVCIREAGPAPTGVPDLTVVNYWRVKLWMLLLYLQGPAPPLLLPSFCSSFASSHSRALSAHLFSLSVRTSRSFFLFAGYNFFLLSLSWVVYNTLGAGSPPTGQPVAPHQPPNELA